MANGSPGPNNGKHDVTTHRMVVGFIGGIAVLASGGITFLAATGHDSPIALVSLGSAAMGSLASMLATIMQRGDD